jgi:glycosyltransferase involved in cell wall biosynthesis
VRALFLTGGTIDPGTRFRVTQFFPYFEAAGIRCEHRGAYGDRYNDLFQTRIGPAYKLACRLKRSGHSVRVGDYDVVFLQRCAFNTTALPERVAARLNPRIVFDFDDAIFLDPSGAPDPRRERAFRQAVSLSARSIAGNRYLAAFAGAPEKTTVIPTVIDTDVYRPAPVPEGEDDRLVIGWMGTSGNFVYFDEIEPAIRQLLSEHRNAVFRIVSNGTYPALLGHPQVEQVPWSAESEIRELEGFDVGIMALADTAWSRGKCGFKLIQYMSVGRPVVASAVGANVEILEGAGAGFLARDGRDWIESLRGLVANAELRRAMGRAARRRIEDGYSIRSVLDRYVAIFESVAQRSGPRRRAVGDGAR